MEVKHISSSFSLPRCHGVSAATVKEQVTHSTRMIPLNTCVCARAENQREGKRQPVSGVTSRSCKGGFHLLCSSPKFSKMFAMST